MPRLQWFLVATLLSCVPLFGQTATLTSLTTSPNPSYYGQAVTLTASVTAGATGMVAFYDGVTFLGAGTISGSQASLTTLMLPSGNRQLSVYYKGNPTYAASRSQVLAQIVVAEPSLGLQDPLGDAPSSPTSAIATGDFNGDTKLDVVLGNATATLTFLMGKGDGTFSAGPSYQLTGAISGIVVSDFNNDGNPDLAVSSASQVSILLGNGDGTFQSPAIYPVGGSGIVVSDFNADGNADLAVGGSIGIVILSGKGDGTFQSAVPVLSSAAVGLAAGDFNGDGQADLAIITPADTLQIILGNGDGTFGAPTTPTVSGVFQTIMTADLNGDGKTDLVIAAPSSEEVFVLLGKGDGTFRSASQYYTAASDFAVVVEDYNGDGVPDLVVTNDRAFPGSSSTFLVVWKGNGDGTFTVSQAYPIYGFGSLITPYGYDLGVAGDFNGDGKPDLAIANKSYYLNQYEVLLGGAVPDLEAAVSHVGGLTQGQHGAEYVVTITNSGQWPSTGLVTVTASLPSALTPTNITGTGWTCVLASLSCTRSDSLAASTSYPAIILRLNVSGQGTGAATSTFTVNGNGQTHGASDTTTIRPPTITALSAAPNPSTLGQSVTLAASVTAGATGRVDFYDGAAWIGSAVLMGGTAAITTSLLPPGVTLAYALYSGDSAYGQSTSQTLAITVNAGSGNGMSPYTSYTTSGTPSSIAAADLNGDGKVDLIAAAGTSIEVFNGNGDGTFRAGVKSSLNSSSPYSSPYTGIVTVADFNNDGKPDVLFGVFLLLGNGDGTFAAPQPITTVSGFSVMAAADFNGDGNVDVVAIGIDSVAVLLGNGDGTFQSPVTIASTGYNVLTVADLNGDGKPDLVGVTGTLNVFLGNGDGTFQAPLVYTLGNSSGPVSLAVGDFNGDSKPDVAVTNGTQLSLFPGIGDGTLEAAIQTVASWSQSAVSGDFNGDGKLDLALASYAQGSFTLLFGDGHGGFQMGPTLPTESYNCILAAGDFNGDGKQDLAVAIGGITAVDVFLGGQFAALSVSASHTGKFTASLTGTYQITVANYAYSPLNGVSVTDTLPAGLTATAIAGTGWTCALSTLICTRGDTLPSGHSYPPITVTVNVQADLQPSVIDNSISASNGATVETATDPTTIYLHVVTSLSISPSPSVAGNPITLTATLTAGASGTVLFSANGAALQSAPVAGGQAVWNTTLLPTGLGYFEAAYAGDATHAPSSSGAASAVIRAAPANGFAPPVTYATGGGAIAIAIGDFDGDGHPDMATVDEGAGTVNVLLGRGGGTFSPATAYAVAGSPQAVAVADLNNDGHPDLAVSATSVSILLGNGDGTFQPAVTVPNLRVFGNLVAADFNSDGAADLLVVSAAGLTLLPGKGDGSFLPPVGLGPAASGGLITGDFNGDGRADFFDGAGLFLGNGDGTFLGHPFSGSAQSSMATGDLNADGKADIVEADNQQGIDVFLANGDGTFQPAVAYGANSGFVSGISLADVNGDGKLDVVANELNGVTIFYGNGDGTLQPPVVYLQSSETQTVAAEDLNGDGRIDLAVLNGGTSVTVLLGVLTPALTVTSSHSDPFTLGQTSATFTIVVANAGPGVTSGLVTVSEMLPAGLTATAIAGNNWNCTLTTLTCTRLDSLGVNISFEPIIVTVYITASTVGSGMNTVSVSGGGAAAATSSDATSIVGAAIGFQTVPAGLAIQIGSGAAQPAMNLAPGSYMLSVESPQAGSPGTQYVFTGWSDGGYQAHDITVGAAPATYIASFKTQYQLTATANPVPGGSIMPTSGTYIDSGASVTLTASGNPPYVFAGWSGPSTFTMTGPTAITANFNVPGFTCAVTGDNAASVPDVQQIINEALGLLPPKDNLAHGQVVGVVDAQKVIAAVLGQGCLF